MEKISNNHIDHVIGSDQHKEELISYLDNSGKGKIEGELEKTSRDIEIINFSQKSLDEYLLSFGRENIREISDEKIHIVPVDGVHVFSHGNASEGAANTFNGSCVVDRNINDVIFSLRLFHEFYHIKVFSSITLDEKGFYNPRRSGFGVNVSGEKYFKLINETLDDYLCQKYFNEKIKKSILFDKKEVDSYVFDSPRKNLLDIFEDRIEEMYSKNQEDFNNKEEVRVLFINADLNGRLLPVARLLEKTYGPGTFRKLGEQTK